MSIYINHRRGHGSQSYSEETKTIPKNENEKSYKTYKTILIYDISYKTFMGAKQLHIWFKKID